MLKAIESPWPHDQLRRDWLDCPSLRSTAAKRHCHEEQATRTLGPLTRAAPCRLVLPDRASAALGAEGRPRFFPPNYLGVLGVPGGLPEALLRRTHTPQRHNHYSPSNARIYVSCKWWECTHALQ